MTDQAWMRRAIALARAGVGKTGENPSVGCVIVRDEKVVGEAATGLGGRPHAEEQALAQAGSWARGSVAFVTLEPCAKRSSGAAACSSLLVEAGLSRVVIACEDPSTLAGGRGLVRLRQAGIRVELGLLRHEAASLYETYAPKGSD